VFSEARSGEISLETLPDLTADAFEMARLWVNSERSFVAVAYKREWPPELLGSLMVESMHTAAAAVAAHTGLTEGEALERLWCGFDEERERLKNGD
jgi:hypothetical protein